MEELSTQRQLTALLHELQHARSPLAQARVLARGWRTVRQLSPTGVLGDPLLATADDGAEIFGRLADQLAGTVAEWVG